MLSQIPIANSLIQPSNFFALGDSYSAGIGASCGWIIDEFDRTGSCLRCNGSFPHQVANMTGGVEVYHIACTGALIHDILHPDENNRTAQIELMRSKSSTSVDSPPEWGTLTIGGNDAGFAAVVVNCIAYNRASCDADLNSTDTAISDPRFLSLLVETYLALLEAAASPSFRLIVPGYAQFFNARTPACNGKFLWFGRYLSLELRARVNAMVTKLNLVIQVAVSIVQMGLVFSNSRKSIFYEDWDALFEGHRFCEENATSFANAWFFTIQGADTLPNGTTTVFADLERLKSLNCTGGTIEDLEVQKACDLAIQNDFEKDGDFTVNGYPWWAMKTMHPKTVAHYAMGKQIYQKWMDGEYF